MTRHLEWNTPSIFIQKLTDMEFIKQIDLGVSEVKMPDGTTKVLAHGILGEEGCNAYNGDDAKEAKNAVETLGGEEIFEFFETPAEAAAFWKGIAAMDGYLKYEATPFLSHLEIFTKAA